MFPPEEASAVNISDERLRPFERMKLPREFRRVFRRGRRFGSPFLRIHFAPTNRSYSRLGLVVKRKLGKAVTRNRLKRRLREVFRKHKYRLQRPLDVVLVAERELRSYEEYREVFLRFIASTRRESDSAQRRRP